MRQAQNRLKKLGKKIWIACFDDKNDCDDDEDDDEDDEDYSETWEDITFIWGALGLPIPTHPDPALRPPSLDPPFSAQSLPEWPKLGVAARESVVISVASGVR